MTLSRSLATIRAFALAALLFSMAQGQVTTRVTVDSMGIEFPTYSTTLDISEDGRWVASWRDNLIYVHDRKTGTFSLVTGDPNGVPVTGYYRYAFLSGDGRYVVFDAQSSKFTGSASGYGDVYRRDMTSGTVELVSVSYGGGTLTSGSTIPNVNRDGSRIIFLSLANGIVPGDFNFWPDVFVRDMNTQTNYQVNVDSNGNPAWIVGPKMWWTDCDISADGRFAAYASDAPNLVPNDTNGTLDVFVHDLVTRVTERVSVDSNGVEGNAASFGGVSVSEDGRYVSFKSGASNLVPGDTNGVGDAFVRDRVLGTTIRVNVDSSGLETSGSIFELQLADRGPIVAFDSDSPDLVPGDTNGFWDVFLRDLGLGTTTRVSVDSSGLEVMDGDSGLGGISGDGTLVAFGSDATELVLRDRNKVTDGFVRDTSLNCPPIQVYCTPKPNSLGCKPKVTASGSPSASGETAFFLVGFRFVPDKHGLFFWGLTPKSSPFKGGTLCVQAPLARTPLQYSGSLTGTPDCDREYSFPFDSAYMSSKQLPAGVTVYGQYWAYDNPPGEVSLSDAITFTICP